MLQCNLSHRVLKHRNLIKSSTLAAIHTYKKKNFVSHCPEALRYAKVWGRDVVRSLTLAYTKRLFPDSNP